MEKWMSWCANCKAFEEYDDNDPEFPGGAWICKACGVPIECTECGASMDDDHSGVHA